MLVTAVAIATGTDKATRVVTAIVLVLANAIAGGAANASAGASAGASASVNINGNENAISNVSASGCASAMVVVVAATVFISTSTCVPQYYVSHEAWIWPPGSAAARAERGRGRWLEHDGYTPPGVILPSQKGRTCIDFAARLGRDVGGAWAGEVAGT